jgi:hypothetical protein
MCHTLFSLAAENLQIRRSNPSYDWVIKILYKQFDDLGPKGKALVITHYLQKESSNAIYYVLILNYIIECNEGSRFGNPKPDPIQLPMDTVMSHLISKSLNMNDKKFMEFIRIPTSFIFKIRDNHDTKYWLEVLSHCDIDPSTNIYSVFGEGTIQEDISPFESSGANILFLLTTISKFLHFGHRLDIETGEYYLIPGYEEVYHEEVDFIRTIFQQLLSKSPDVALKRRDRYDDKNILWSMLFNGSFDIFWDILCEHLPKEKIISMIKYRKRGCDYFRPSKFQLLQVINPHFDWEDDIFDAQRKYMLETSFVTNHDRKNVIEYGYMTSLGRMDAEIVVLENYIK